MGQQKGEKKQKREKLKFEDYNLGLGKVIKITFQNEKLDFRKRQA